MIYLWKYGLFRLLPLHKSYSVNIWASCNPWYKENSNWVLPAELMIVIRVSGVTFFRRIFMKRLLGFTYLYSSVTSWDALNFTSMISMMTIVTIWTITIVSSDNGTRDAISGEAGKPLKSGAVVDLSLLYWSWNDEWHLRRRWMLNS